MTSSNEPAPPSAGAADLERDLKLWVVLARAYRAVARHSSADIDRHGLSAGEFAVLEALYHKGPLLLGEVQEKILVSSGGITYLVDRLEERQLVERQACPGDRRARYAALTQAGRELMDRVFPEHARAIAHALEGLGPDERAMAIELLRRLGRHAAATPPRASPD